MGGEPDDVDAMVEPVVPAVLDEHGLEVALHNQVRAFEATSGVACAISTGPRPGSSPTSRRCCTGSPRRR